MFRFRDIRFGNSEVICNHCNASVNTYDLNMLKEGKVTRAMQWFKTRDCQHKEYASNYNKLMDQVNKDRTE